MSWKPEVFVSGAWYPNGIVFETKEEAEQNARDKFMSWTQCDDSRAVESDLPVNATYHDRKLVML